jgi:apolipoprotein N-acyltransferase
MTVVRAVEQQRPLVRASTLGPSVIVTPLGRIATRSAAFAPAVLHGSVSPREGLTLYGRVGDASAVARALLAVAACARRR